MKQAKQNDPRELSRSASITSQRASEVGSRLTNLRGELKQAENSRAVLTVNEPGQWASLKARLKFGSKTATLDRRIEDLKSQIAELDREYEALSADLAESQKQLDAANQKSDYDRRSRCAAAAKEAAESAPSRKRFWDARNKWIDAQHRLREVEAEIHKICTTPITEATDGVTERAREFLNGGDLNGDTSPANEGVKTRILELTRHSKTLATAIRIQEREMSAAQREFAQEVATNIKPKFSDLAQRMAAAVRELLNATAEDLLLRTAVAVETQGRNEDIPALRFPGVNPDFANQMIDGYLNRLRLSGYEV